MKKLLVLLFASLLVLGACGQKEETTSKEETTKKSDSKDEKKDNEKKDKSETKDKDKESVKKSKPKTEEQSTEEVTTEEPQSVEEDATEQPTQGQQYDDGHTYHYDPEYDRYGYTGMVDEDGMPVLDPNENFDPHGGATPGEDYVPEDDVEEESNDSPRSLREIKEDTGKGASDFTQAEIDEANAYAREH